MTLTQWFEKIPYVEKIISHEIPDYLMHSYDKLFTRFDALTQELWTTSPNRLFMWLTLKIQFSFINIHVS